MDNHELEIAVKRFSEGDGQYFDIIYDETKTHVYYTILCIVKNPADAEDLMQDTYLKMVESLPRYRGQNAFRGWLTTIARNLSLNALKRRRRELPTAPEESVLQFEQTQATQEESSVLHELLDVLSDDEKQVVIRHVVLEHKHKDIAKDMKKPLGTITWMYQNALKKMRKKAGEDDA